MNHLRTDTVVTEDWQSKHWQLRSEYCELEGELADLNCEYQFMLDMFLDLCDLLQEEGFVVACEFPPLEVVPEDEALTELMPFEDVEPLPVKPVFRLKLLK